MFRRSNHISVQVRADELETAVQHYKDLFRLQEIGREAGSVELKGSNFTIWIDAAEKPVVLQEFVTGDADEARRAVERSGGTVTGESPFGFYVTDPYGMSYHVYIEDEAET